MPRMFLSNWLEGPCTSVKLVCPMTISAEGSRAPAVRDADGKRRMRLLPASATKRLPALSMAIAPMKGPLPLGQEEERQMVLADGEPPWFPCLEVNLSGWPSTMSGLWLPGLTNGTG